MFQIIQVVFNPLNAELNPICHLLALLRAHRILHVGRIRVKAVNMRIIFLPLKSTNVVADIYLLTNYTEEIVGF
jgi:hypothetical protein